MATIDTNSGFASYRDRVARFDSLSFEQEAALAHAWRNGHQRSGARLIEANLKFVIGIAYEYRRWGAPIDDLVQQGNIGLLKAAARYDPEQQSGLRAYAAYWIRAEIRDYVVRCYRIVRLGTTRTERRALRAFRSTPVDTVEELAEKSGMPQARCQMLWPLLCGSDRSLDFSYGGGPPARERLGDSQPDAEAQLIEQESAQLKTREVKRALSLLSERERDIVRARMMTDEPMTLDQLGRRMGVSRERVRQIESRAKDKIRAELA